MDIQKAPVLTDKVKEQLRVYLESLSDSWDNYILDKSKSVISYEESTDYIHSLYSKLIEHKDKEIEELKIKIAGYEGWERSINEALNTGDGSYRP